MNKDNGSTIHLIDCQILAHNAFEGNQHILTLNAPKIAQATQPGQFVHISVCDDLLMRRPISIMAVDSNKGTFDLLYKVIGEGTRALAKRKIGETLSVIGPIGTHFKLHKGKRPLLIGGGVGMPPIIAIAQQIKDTYPAFAILGSEVPFPFDETLAGSGKNYAGASHTMPLLEEWGVACRLASLQGYEGVFKGFVTDLAQLYLNTLSTQELAQVEVYACGPHSMLKGVAKLAEKYNLPCQVSLEEYMACAVGGCAGCVVEVQTDDGTAMKRVCVDGPIFDAKTIF